MATVTVAELLVSIGVDAKEAQEAMERLAGGFDNAGGAAQRANAKIQRMERIAGKAANTLRNVILGLGAALAGVGRAVLATGGEFESLAKQLKTATGSAQGAEKALSFIKDFAKNTPFQVQEITSAFVKLQNFGLEPTRESLESFGNLASAMGKDLDQVIEAVLDATTGEFERLKELGIKTKSQGDQVSFTFRGVTTTVGKNAAEIQKFLTDIGNVQFAGAMSEQMSTLGGLTSNLKDTFTEFLLEVAELGPLDEFKKLVADLRDRIGGGRGLARTLADTLTRAIRRVRDLIRGGFLDSLTKVVDVIVLLIEHMDKLIALFIGAKIAQAFAAAAQGLTALGFAASGALGPIGLVAGALAALIPLAIDAGNAIGDAISAAPGARVKKRGAPSVALANVPTPEARELAPKLAAARQRLEAARDTASRQRSALASGLAAGLGVRQQGGGGEDAAAVVRAAEQNLATLEREEQRIVREHRMRLENDRAKRAAFDLKVNKIKSAIDRARIEGPRKSAAMDRALAVLNETGDVRAAIEAANLPDPRKRRGRGRGRGKKAKRQITSPTTVSEFFAAAARGDLGPIAARTPSTKDIEPTVAVDITNYNFDVKQEIRSSADAKQVADSAVAAIKREFRVRLDRAGRSIAGGAVL